MSLERENVGGMPTVAGLGTVSGSALDPRSQLLQEMREQNYDLIRFASYRTACKLRYVQKKCNCKLYMLFLYNFFKRVFNINYRWSN